MKFLVVDSGAFIKNSPVHEYAENIYTVEGVIKEIKDVATRQRLQFLPYKLNRKEPSQDIYKFVLEFSKKTGDYTSLSVTDLQVIALTYQLEKENVGTDHLNSEPSCQVSGFPTEANKDFSGFYVPNEDQESDPENESEPLKNNDNLHEEVECEESDPKNESEPLENNDNLHEEVGCEESDEESLSGSDDEGWITPSNISEIQKKMGSVAVTASSEVTVACITTDFAIQNMLRQLGLHIISVDGMLIKHTNVYILRCFSCFKLTSNMEKKFCPNCGNSSLKRVAVTFNEDGTKNIHINFKRPINIRGTRYSLPTPQGGKHARNPILCADQKVPHNRPTNMALKKTDALNPDYDSFTSPFAVNDVYSRAFQLGIRSARGNDRKKNPNEWPKRTGNKKRR